MTITENTGSIFTSSRQVTGPPSAPPPPPRPESLTVGLIVDAITTNPASPEGHALAWALRDAYARPGSNEHGLFAALADTPVVVPPKIPAYRSPALAAPADLNAPSEPLSGSDIAWLAKLSEDPAKVADADVQYVARLAAARRPESDRRLLSIVLDPIKAHHEARAKVAQLERVIALAPRNPADPSTHPQYGRAVGLIAQRIQHDTPELTADEARVRARAEIVKGVERHGAADSAAVQARRNLTELLKATGLRSEHFPDAHTWQIGPPPYPGR